MDRVTEDKARMFLDQDPITAPITLYDALGRALKYNLDQRVQRVQEALAFGQMKSAALEMLPQLSTSVSRTHRSEYSASYSESMSTGAMSLELSKSQEKTRTVGDVSFMWSALDFGVSYLTAKQQADQYLIAQEHRRKAVQDLVRDVRTAYWQAVSAEAMLPRMNTLLSKAYEALDRSQQMEREKLQEPDQAMGYQAELLQHIRQLLSMRRDLDMAKFRLASLMNLKPGTPFTVDTSARAAMRAPDITFDIPYLEELALANRPELREQDYEARIGAHEVRKAMVSMLPSLDLTVGRQYDSNKYLYQNNWFDVAAQISYNIMSLITGPQNAAVARTQISLAQNRRLSLGMAVITQVNLALRQYHHVRQEYQVVERIHNLNVRRSERAQAAQAAEQGDELTAIQAEVASVVSSVQRDFAYAETQDALGMVFHAVGMDPIPDVLLQQDLATLAVGIEEHWQRDQELIQQQDNTIIVSPQEAVQQPTVIQNGSVVIQEGPLTMQPAPILQMVPPS